jgi:hypothetical protein
VAFGETLLLGLRIDTNRLPAEIRRAYRAMAESARAAASETGLVSKREKREAGEEADERCRQELATGRHVRSIHVPVVWDLRRRLLLAPIFSDTTSAVLRELFAATFDGSLEPLSSGALASELLSARGLGRDYEDLTPSPFTPPPPAAHDEDGRGTTIPTPPWSFGGPEPKDFLGNEMLIWLWATCETGSAMIETKHGEVAIAIDRALDMDCAWDATGKQTLRADAPTRLPEAGAALRIGKWPRKAGLMIAAEGEQWELTFQADRFLITGAKLSKPEEPPASPRELIEMRLASLEALDRAMVDLFDAFLAQRASGAWPTQRQRIREWIGTRTGRRPVRSDPAVEIAIAS